MKQEKQQEIALMRYGAIAPMIAGLDERYPSKTAFYTEISAKGLMGPDGKLHHYAPATIEKWYLDYQNHGFEGLVPKGRSDAGMSRKLDEELQERIRYFKTNYPRMSAAAIYRQLKYDAVSVFFASWCFALPLALLRTFVFHWPVMVVYILMCSDEIVKLPWLYQRYKKYLWLNNLTRDTSP